MLEARSPTWSCGFPPAAALTCWWLSPCVLTQSSVCFCVLVSSYKNNSHWIRASLVAQRGENLPAMQETQETWIQSQGWEDPLEEGMVTHSSILVWKIPWTGKAGRLQSMGTPRVRQDWSNLAWAGVIGLRSTLITSFYFNYLFKEPIFKYSSIREYWGLGFQYIKFGRTEFSP